MNPFTELKYFEMRKRFFRPMTFQEIHTTKIDTNSHKVENIRLFFAKIFFEMERKWRKKGGND